MKFSIILFLGGLVSCAADKKDLGAKPSYVSEAPLPQGWPLPGSYDTVSEKSYPASRAAITNEKGEFLAFTKLFRHIKKNNIPMSAPVEMEMGTGKDAFEQTSMAFFYQKRNIGVAGAIDQKLEVRDLPPVKVLSYAWQGEDSKENIAKAKDALDASLVRKKVTPVSFRVLGYNGPNTSRFKRTWELQALLK